MASMPASNVVRLPKTERLILLGDYLAVGLFCGSMLAIMFFPSPVVIVAVIVINLPVLGFGLWQFLRRKRLDSSIAAHHGKLCQNCEYPLVGLDESHACPECGSRFEMDKTVEYWNRFLRLKDQLRKVEMVRLVLVGMLAFGCTLLSWAALKVLFIMVERASSAESFSFAHLPRWISGFVLPLCILDICVLILPAVYFLRRVPRSSTLLS